MQGQSNATMAGAVPRLCNRGCRKNGALILSPILSTKIV